MNTDTEKPKMKTVPFASLRVGDIFYNGKYRYQKMDFFLQPKGGGISHGVNCYSYSQGINTEYIHLECEILDKEPEA